MYAPNLPQAWEIAEMERLRRIHDSQPGERPLIPLAPPVPSAPPSSPRADPPGTGRSVIVIDLA